MKKNLRLLAIATVLVLVFFLRTSTPPPDRTEPVIGVVGQMGYLIEQVLAGSPAKEAGLLPGDILLAVNEIHITSPSQFHQLLTATPKETDIHLRLYRFNTERNGWQPRSVAVPPAGIPVRPR